MQEALSILKTYYGFEQFRPEQADIVNTIAAGKDCLGLLPTGGGKSICFQVPALMREGLCIVVTPLVALMKDQVENLKAKDIKAVALFNGMSRKELEFELENCVNGQYKFLYVSPERLASKAFTDYARHMPVSLLTVDEAHCISQWGYDFRPPYIAIAKFRALFDGLQCVALTATATPEVVKDIIAKLELKQAVVIQKSFTRPNLIYAVQNSEQKREKLLELCKKIKGSGLIYVKNRRKTADIASYLNDNGIAADYYHAGLDHKVRERKQSAWKTNEIRVMVCTNAFGMGIDKPDVRWVIHEQKPDSIEAYYQEAGRAGRDGQKAFAILLYHASDFIEDEKNCLSKYPSSDQISRVYELLCNHLKIAVGSGLHQTYAFDIQAFAKHYQLSIPLVYNSLKLLEQEGYLQTNEGFYLPSRLKILCQYEALYAWQMQHSKIDELVKVLLRSYGGLFDFYMPIYEFDIARRVGQSVAWVKQQLQALHSANIVDYIAQSNEPNVLMLENRAPKISFSEAKIEFLRARYREKLAFMNRYVLNTHQCRTKLLVEYFGEHMSQDCGYCEVCIKAAQSNKQKAERLEHIKTLLKNQAMPLEQLLSQIDSEQRTEYLHILRWLKEQNWVAEDSNGLWHWQHTKS